MSRTLSYNTSLTELTHQRNFASFSISGVSKQEYRNFCASSYKKFSDRRTLLLAEEYAELQRFASSSPTELKKEFPTKPTPAPDSLTQQKTPVGRALAREGEPARPEIPSIPQEPSRTQDIENSLLDKSREDAEKTPSGSGLHVDFEDESGLEEESRSLNQATIHPNRDTLAQLPETPISAHKQLSSVLEEKRRFDSFESEELRKFKEQPSVRFDEEELSYGMPEGVEQVRDYIDYKMEESSYPEHDAFTESEESVTDYSHPELDVSRSDELMSKEQKDGKKEKKAHHKILLKGLKKIFKRKKKRTVSEKEVSENEKDSASSF